MNKLRTLPYVFLIFVFTALCANLSAQSIWTHPIEGNNPGSFNPYTTGQTSDPHLIVTGIGRGSGITGVTASNRYNATGWNSTAIDVNDYFEFTLTPNSSYKINFSNFEYMAQRTGNGPLNFAFRSSVDNYATNIGSPSVTGSTISLSANTYQNIASPIIFRFYGWGGNGGNFSVNDFIFNGTVTTPPKYYRTESSGNWNNPNTWQSSPDNIIWSAATTWPAATDHAINIQTAHAVSVNTAESLDETVIAGALNVQDGGVLNIKDGIGSDVDILNNGVLNVTSTSSYETTIIFASASKLNIATGGKVTVGNGSVAGGNYNVFATGSNSIWNNNSIFEWNSTNDFGLNALTFFPNANSTTIPVLRITASAATSGGSGAALINGILEVNNNLTLAGSGPKTFRDGITGSGILTLNTSTGGYTISSATAIIGGTLSLVLNANLKLDAGVRIPTGANVNISGTASINKSSGSFLVDGALDITTIKISNTSGNLTVNGLLKTSNPAGFCNTGATIVSGTIILNTSSTIEFNALGNQDVSDRSDFTYKNIKFSGSGIKTINSGFNPEGTVTITGAAIVDIKNSTFGNTGTNLVMDGGRLRMSGISFAKPDIAGTYSLTGGVIEFYNTGTTGLQTIRGVTAALNPIEYNQIEVTGDKVANSNANITLRNNGIFTIKSGGVFEINTDAIVGPAGVQTVIIENGATFKCGDADGFSGNLNNPSIRGDVETIILGTGSTVEYAREGVQLITNAGDYINLLISGTGIKTAPSGILTIKGNLSKTNTSTFAHNGGTVLLSGTNQNFAGLTYNNLILLNGTKTTIGNSSITESIKISAATTLILAQDNSITLHSDLAKTARVEQVEGSIIYGTNSKFIVERYIPGHRAWRLLTAPVKNTAQTINQAWQEGAVNTDLDYTHNQNPKPGYGTHITGINKTTDAAFGFDPGPQNNTSLKYFDNGWFKLPIGTGTNNSLINSKPALMLFVRGDRSVDIVNHVNNPIPLPTVLRVSGELNTGTQPVINIDADTMKLIGNPYASAINMRKINKTGIAQFYLWDANLGTLGAFQTFHLNAGGNYQATPGQGSYPGGINNFIQSGQGFFVTTSAQPGTVTFDESAKEVSSTSSIFEPVTITTASQLKTNIYAADSVSSVLMDGVLINFDNAASNNIDEFDAVKLTNFSSSIGMSRGGKVLVVERRKVFNLSDTVFYQTSQLGKRNYQLEFIAENLSDPFLQAFVEDSFLGTLSEIKLDTISRINFSVTTETSAAFDRFKLIFKRLSPPVAKTVVTLKAAQQNLDIALEWIVENQKSIVQYEVERSAEEKQFFKTLFTIKAANNMNDTILYKWVDERPLSGNSYYRVKSIHLNGEVEYSNTTSVAMPAGKAEVSVFPNPVVGGIINLHLYNYPEGNYSVRLTNNAGQVVLTQQIKHKTGTSTEQIRMSKALSTGNYLLEFLGKGNKKSIFNVFK